MRPSKRDEIVHKALDAFYKNGFHATGMDMLVKEMGISKTAIYNHFRTKDELILAVLRLRDEKFRNWLFRRMEELAVEPGQQLIALFDVLGEWFNEKTFQGCMFIKAASEFQDPEHPIRKHCTDHKMMIANHLLGLAKSEKLKDPSKLVKQLMLLKEGAIVSAHLQLSKTPEIHAKEAAIDLITSSRG